MTHRTAIGFDWRASAVLDEEEAAGRIRCLAAQELTPRDIAEMFRIDEAIIRLVLHPTLKGNSYVRN